MKTDEKLVNIPLSQIEPHPSNPNLMSQPLRDKLAENISRSGRYPPPVVRPLSPGRYQLLDGEQRCYVLRDLGETSAWCLVWPCSDEDALILLAALNRLQGDDVPGRRAQLLSELSAYESLAELARLLPEEEAELEQQLTNVGFDLEAEISRLAEQAQRAEDELPVLFSFAVPRDEAAVVEAALDLAMSGLEGTNRRGQSLRLLAESYLEREGRRAGDR